MKNLTTLLFAILLLIGTGSALFAQGVVDERAWSRVQVNPLPSGTKYNMPNWIPADPIYRFYGVGMGATVGPNYR
ncbi:MAG: hypothetical protein OQK77_02935, partial [Psychromonas sp.]|nr:hypothetical protein [Psychromonas sp.]